MRQPTASPRVLVVGTSRLFAETLAESLRRHCELESAEATGRPGDALELARAQSINVVLVDARAQSLPHAQAITAGMKEQMPGVSLLVLGPAAAPAAILDFIEAGATGYLPCEVPIARLVETIVAVRQGQTPCSPALAAAVFQRLRELAQPHADLDGGPPRLSGREKEILDSLVTGRKNKEIARQLRVRVSTVKNHMHKILTKLHLKNRNEAARWARRRGLEKNAGSTAG